MQRKKWFGVGAVAGLVLSTGVLLALSSAVWAGGASVIAQPNPVISDNTDGLIVKFRDRQVTRAQTMGPTQVNGLSASAGIGLTHYRAMSGDAQVFKLPQHLPLAEVEAIARRLSADPQVEYAEPDRIMRLAPAAFPANAGQNPAAEAPNSAVTARLKQVSERQIIMIVQSQTVGDVEGPVL